MSGTSRFKPPDMLLDLELVAPFLDATLRSAIGSAILCWVTKASSRNQAKKDLDFRESNRCHRPGRQREGTTEGCYDSDERVCMYILGFGFGIIDALFVCFFSLFPRALGLGCSLQGLLVEEREREEPKDGATEVEEQHGKHEVVLVVREEVHLHLLLQVVHRVGHLLLRGEGATSARTACRPEF